MNMNQSVTLFLTNSPRKLSRISVFATAALLIFLIFTAKMQVTAAPMSVRYVSLTGSDSGGNDCSNSSNPCKTVQYAVNMANSGDTIQLAAGTYPVNVTLFNNLTLTGAGVGQTILDGGDSERVILVWTGTVVSINDLTIRNGRKDNENGAGITNWSDLTLNNVEVTANTSYQGGGISNEGTLTIANSSIHSNTTSSSGGGLINWGTVTINGSVFHNNTVQELSGSGGGFLNSAGGSISLTNVTISGNHAVGSGSAFTTGGSVSLLNVTIAENVATGIYNSGTITFKNALVANNGSQQCQGTGTFTSQGNNLESGNSCHFNQSGDQVSANPRLFPLANNGGSTETHNMQANSPAIDAGTDVGCPTQDQRGKSRPTNGNGSGSAACDIGAIEFDPTIDGKTYIFLPVIIR